MSILGADNFANNGRVLSPGWNTSYDTQVWRILAGSSASWSVTAGSGGVVGKGRHTGSTAAQVGALGTGTSYNLDVRCRVSVSNSADSAAVSGRMTAYNTAYRAKLQNNQLILLVTVAGTQTILGSVTFATTPGTLYQLHLRLRGTTISANAWADGTIEPSGFMVSATDSQIVSPGYYGVVTGLAVSTDIVTYDQFVATNPTQVADGPYGVTVALSFKNPPASNYAHWCDLFADMRVLGLSWLRFQVSWYLIQQNTMQFTPSSQWAWAPLDDAVARCNEAGIFLCHPLQDAPTWAIPGPNSYQYTNEPTYTMDPVYAATYASALAARYNGQNGYGTLHAYEVGNEQYNIHFTPASPPASWRGLYNSPYSEYNGLSGTSAGVQPARDPHGYAQCLPGIATAIRSAAPGMRVGHAAIWWNQYPNCKDFLAGTYAEVANAGTLTTFANFHYYSNGRDPSLAGSGGSYSPSFQQEWQAMQTALVAASDGTKPVWCTEVGWGINTNNGATADCTPTVQSTRYQYVYGNAQASSGAVSKVFFYTLSYKTQDTNANPITDTSSIVQWDVASQTYIQQPAYGALAAYTAANPVWTAAVLERALFPTTGRRLGTLPASRRRLGTLPITSRRES